MRRNRSTTTARLGREPLGALACALMVSCAPSAPAPDVVATSTLGEVRAADLEEFILAFPESQRAPSPGENLDDWRRTKLEDLILARAAEAEARELGLGETEDGRARLAAIREPLLVEELSARMIEERVKVGDEELRAFYEANPQDFGHADQIRVRNLYKRVDADAPPEVWEATRQEMEGYVDQLRRGARFEDLAKEHSDSETAALEGLIGRINRGKLEPRLEEMLFDLEEGEISEVLKTSNGFQLFKVENHIGTFKMPFEEARTRLLRRLTREGSEAAERAFIGEIVEASGATYRPEALSGAPDALVFELDAEAVSLDDFHDLLTALPFHASREQSLELQLQELARARLYLWEAERQGLAEEPLVAEKLVAAERQTLISLALEERRRAVLDSLDEQALRDYHATHKERFSTPRLIRVSLITRSFPEDRSAWYRVYEELVELAEEIRAGRREFADAARELSTDFTASRGGEAGAIRPDAIAEWAGPQAQRAVLGLRVDEISEPLLIERFNSNRMTYDREGYMLVRLDAIELTRERGFEEARDLVVERYVQQGDEDLNQRIRSELLDSIDARIYSENL